MSVCMGGLKQQAHTMEPEPLCKQLRQVWRHHEPRERGRTAPIRLRDRGCGESTSRVQIFCMFGRLRF